MAGRPKKYTEDFLNKEATALLRYIHTAKPIPFLKDFCYKRKYSSARIAEFAEANPSFAEALGRLKDAQERALVFGGLEAKLNPFMCMQTLKNTSGWRDKSQDEESGVIINQVINVLFSNGKTNNHTDPSPGLSVHRFDKSVAK